MAISARSLALDGLTAPIRPLVVAVCGLLASSTSTTLGYPREVRVDVLELVVACDAPEREARTVAPRCAVVVEQAARGAVARETAWGLEVEAVAREASASVTAWGFEVDQVAHALDAGQASRAVLVEQVAREQRPSQAVRAVIVT